MNLDGCIYFAERMRKKNSEKSNNNSNNRFDKRTGHTKNCFFFIIQRIFIVANSNRTRMIFNRKIIELASIDLIRLDVHISIAAMYFLQINFYDEKN